MKYSYSGIFENECTILQYIEQFNPIKIELGKEYVASKGTWHEEIYRIDFIDDKIALGTLIKDSYGGLSLGEKRLFYVSDGFKYKDYNRPIYRLQKLDEN